MSVHKRYDHYGSCVDLFTEHEKFEVTQMFRDNFTSEQFIQTPPQTPTRKEFLSTFHDQVFDEKLFVPKSWDYTVPQYKGSKF